MKKLIATWHQSCRQSVSKCNSQGASSMFNFGHRFNGKHRGDHDETFPISKQPNLLIFLTAFPSCGWKHSWRWPKKTGLRRLWFLLWLRLWSRHVRLWATELKKTNNGNIITMWESSMNINELRVWLVAQFSHWVEGHWIGNYTPLANMATVQSSVFHKIKVDFRNNWISCSCVLIEVFLECFLRNWLWCNWPSCS